MRREAVCLEEWEIERVVEYTTCKKNAEGGTGRKEVGTSSWGRGMGQQRG